MSATTNPSVAGSRRESFHKASVLTAESTSTGGSVGLTAPRMSRRFAIRQGNTISQRNFTVGPSVGARSTLRVSGQQFSPTPQIGSMGRSFGTAPSSARFGMIGGHRRSGFGGGRR
jgi:hypothetical protein